MGDKSYDVYPSFKVYYIFYEADSGKLIYLYIYIVISLFYSTYMSWHQTESIFQIKTIEIHDPNT